MTEKDKHLHELCPCVEPDDIFVEITAIISMMFEAFNFCCIERIHQDIGRLFLGEYPGYRASNTAYHDIRHTYAVVLAMIRILHGLQLNGRKFSPRQVTLGVCCGFFHDTGLIQEENDSDGTGAKYTIGHEQRSISLLTDYLSSVPLSEDELDDCTQVIRCTILAESSQQFTFHDPVMKTIGLVLGTADLIAQMADRQYLEKLPFLFREFKEGGLHGYDTELEIIEKTEEFYHSVALKRLAEDLGNIGTAVKDHFRVRWNIDKNLYDVAIQQNMFYLRALRDECEKTLECYQQKLRRGGGGAEAQENG